jgi:hypothetical protein
MYILWVQLFILPRSTKKKKSCCLQSTSELYRLTTGQWILVPTFADRGVPHGQRSGIPMAVNLSFLYRSRYFFFQGVPHLCSWGWVDSVPDPLLLRKSGRDRYLTHNLYVCSQEFWPLDHRGGLSSCPANNKCSLMSVWASEIQEINILPFYWKKLA